LPLGRRLLALLLSLLAGLALAQPALAAPAPDLTFGGDGTVMTGGFVDGGLANALAIQQDGKIVAAGSSGGPTFFILARYLAE
jgi:hypothetical protein